MARLTIEVSPELKKRLQDTATKRGLKLGEFVRLLLEVSPYVEREPGPAVGENGLRHMPQEKVEALARVQGAPLAVRFEDLLGDFWPEDESCDDFIATIRQWRREGKEGGSPTEE
jgi:hypothetical protein